MRTLKERVHLKEISVDETIIIKLIFKKWDGHGVD